MPMSEKNFKLKNRAERYRIATEDLIAQTDKLLQTLKFIGVESFGDSTLIYRYAQTRDAVRQAKLKMMELKGSL